MTITALIDDSKKKTRMVIISKNKREYDKLVKSLRTVLVGTYKKQQRKAIEDVIRYVTSQKSYTKLVADEVNIRLSKHLGSDLQKLVEKSVTNFSTRTYRQGLKEVQLSTGVQLSFNLTDGEASKILGKQSLFWVGSYYDDKLSHKVDKVLGGYFSSGKTIQEVADEFRASYSKIAPQGVGYFEAFAEHTTTRIRELGHVTGYEKAGISYYQISAVLDDVTSEICREMHGKIFPVSKGIEFRDEILSLTDPDQIKEFAPWVPADEVAGIPADDLDVGMSLPPYHFRCRTITVAYFD